MRIRGRRLYPSTLAERRVMMSFGGTPLYAPRGISPYLIARRVARAAKGETGDIAFVRHVFTTHATPHRVTSGDVAVPTSPLEVELPSDQGTIAA